MPGHQSCITASREHRPTRMPVTVSNCTPTQKEIVIIFAFFHITYNRLFFLIDNAKKKGGEGDSKSVTIQ
jgi:hypothetical protein